MLVRTQDALRCIIHRTSIAMPDLNRLFGKPWLASGLCALLCLQQQSSHKIQAEPLPKADLFSASAFPQGRPRPPHRPDAGRRIATRARKDTLAAWTRRYRAKYPSRARAYYINAGLVADIVKQVNGANAPRGGLRMYFGLDSVGTEHVILVAVDRSGRNLIESSTRATATAGFVLGECEDRCPENCDPTSSLEQ